MVEKWDKNMEKAERLWRSRLFLKFLLDGHALRKQEHNDLATARLVHDQRTLKISVNITFGIHSLCDAPSEVRLDWVLKQQAPNISPGMCGTREKIGQVGREEANDPLAVVCRQTGDPFVPSPIRWHQATKHPLLRYRMEAYKITR